MNNGMILISQIWQNNEITHSAVGKIANFENIIKENLSIRITLVLCCKYNNYLKV
jgi:hypothetical protein